MIIHHNASHRIGSSYVAPPPPTTDLAASLRRYLETLAPMPRAKAADALLRHVRFDGEIMRRWQFAEKLLAEGSIRHDLESGRLYHGSDGHFHDVSALSITLVRYLLWRLDEKAE